MGHEGRQCSEPLDAGGIVVEPSCPPLARKPPYPRLGRARPPSASVNDALNITLEQPRGSIQPPSARMRSVRAEAPRAGASAW